MKKSLTLSRHEQQQGQVLLVVVLLLATVLTVVMTVVFTSRTESQLSKLEQDADRSLAGAEAGIEAAIGSLEAGQSKSFAELGLENLSGIDPKSMVKAEEPAPAKFVSPVISKDQQYTLYLTPYTEGEGDGFGPLGIGTLITVLYGTETETPNCAALALEFTVVNISGNTTIVKHVADTAGNLGGSSIGQSINPPVSIRDTEFHCEANVPITATSRLIFVRIISDSVATRIGVNDETFPAQGTNYISEAKTTTGVVKKIQLFESYPQLPAELFVTSYGRNEDS